MATIPVIGRLSFFDYFRLIFAFGVLFLEALFRVIFAIFPPLRWIVDGIKSIVDNVREQSQQARRGSYKKDDSKAYTVEEDLLRLLDTEDFARYW